MNAPQTAEAFPEAELPGQYGGFFSREALQRLDQMAQCLQETDLVPYDGPVRVGVDLGTANVVIAVLGGDNTPVAVRARRAHVVRDGIVVDFLGAARLLREMKSELEKALGRKLGKAACAIPPGIHPGSVRIIQNTLEAADFQVSGVGGEPEAAGLALGVVDGAVVDVGGGTTGISILRGGKSVFSADEATGGTHMTLVLSGAYGMELPEAEEYKLNNSGKPEVFTKLQPVVEKMASIVGRSIRGRGVKRAFVVGGACCLPNFEPVFEAALGIPVFLSPHPLLVTPLGIAMCCEEYR